MIPWSQVLGPLYQELKTELAALEDALGTHPKRCVRATKNRQLPFASSAVPWFAAGHFIDDNVRPGSFLNFVAGDYYIQDASSMLALALCAQQQGELFCDLCSAPGGKATGLLEQLDGRGFLLANEVISSRVQVLSNALERSGYSNWVVSNAEVESLGKTQQQFDLVLVDAPCSGQSLLMKNKQSLAAFSATQVEHSAARQSRILLAAADLVRPGGSLVYSTCTFAYEENEARVEEFLSKNSEWKLVGCEQLDRWESEVLANTYRIWPQRERCGGAFAARLVRLEEQSPVSLSNIPKVAKSRWKDLKSGVEWPGFEVLATDRVRASGRLWHLFPEAIENSLLPVVTRSVGLAESQVSKSGKTRNEPCHAAAVVADAAIDGRREVALSDEEAIRYFRGESIQLATSDIGWCIATWRGRRLGWLKLTRRGEVGIAKNHLPKMLRTEGLQS